METMQSWYGLRDAHKDFTIETNADAQEFFARHELNNTLLAMLRRSFRTGSPPKLVLYGDWGIGKTHTMRHMEYVIANDPNFDASVVFVELPDIVSRSTFQVAHAASLDAIGLDVVRSWLLKHQALHPNDARELIQEATQSSDVALSFGNLLAVGDAGRISWDWLRGIQLSSAEARLVGLSTVLGQSALLVRVLELLGSLSLEVDGKTVVLMLDEATKLGAVANNDAVNHWTNAFKTLADPLNRDLGFIVSGSWIDPDDMALPLQDVQVHSRFGEHNYIRLNNLDRPEIVTFVRALLDKWVDPDRRTAIIQKYESQAEGEAIDGSFPMTSEGLEVFVEYAGRHGGVTTPRDIQKDLDDLLNRAIDDDKRLLSGPYLTSLVMG